MAAVMILYGTRTSSQRSPLDDANAGSSREPLLSGTPSSSWIVEQARAELATKESPQAVCCMAVSIRPSDARSESPIERKLAAHILLVATQAKKQ